MIGHNRPAGTPAHIGWHRDCPPWSHPTQVLKAKVFYYLDDVDADMGCCSIVPGSHTWPDDSPGSANSFSGASKANGDETLYVGEHLVLSPSAPA